MSYEKLHTESYANIGGINTKASMYVNDIMEFRSIVNMDFSTPGALTKRPGTDRYLGATVSGRITGLYEFERLNGASYLVATANTNAYTVTTSSFSAFKTGLLNGAIFDFVTFVDRLFMCNGDSFFIYDGTNVYDYSIPAGATFGVTAAIGGGLSGLYIASYGYLTERGVFGSLAYGMTISLNGATFGSIVYYGLTTPNGFGATAIYLYRTNASGVDLTGTTFATIATTTVTDTGFPLSTNIDPGTTPFTLAPRYIEIYNNQLFMAGFSAIPSTVVWSQIGEPQGVEPEFNAEIRTNDGDRITGLKTYLSTLFITKERSVHRIVGDDPTNFAIQEVTDQYGCLSNRAIVIWEDKLWWLDPKGVCEYNGSSIQIKSTKVEDIFLRMNINAARDNAIAIHNRLYNQVWWVIPIDSSIINNIIVVYDYVADAWTTFEGLSVSSLALVRQGFPLKTTFFGGYTGTISYFGSSLTYDTGAGITCLFRTSFLANGSQTTQKQFRRFYLNVDAVAGVTQPISTQFYTDYGSSLQLSRTMYQAPFQSRLEFGLNARSVQAQVEHFSASLSLRVYGFSFVHRFQRDI